MDNEQSLKVTEPKHILIEGDSLIISENLEEIFRFIIAIEEEVNNFLNLKERLKKITDQFLDIFDLVINQNKILKENGIEYPFKLKEDPKTIAEKLELDAPVRSQAIVLFSFFETLRVLWTAYELETISESKLRDASDNAIDNFIKNFCLTGKNDWYKKNSKRSGKICIKNLRDLRNSLIHFFSVRSLSLVPIFTSEVEQLSKKNK